MGSQPRCPASKTAASAAAANTEHSRIRAPAPRQPDACRHLQPTSTPVAPAQVVHTHHSTRSHCVQKPRPGAPGHPLPACSSSSPTRQVCWMDTAQLISARPASTASRRPRGRNTLLASCATARTLPAQLSARRGRPAAAGGSGSRRNCRAAPAAVRGAVARPAPPGTAACKTSTTAGPLDASDRFYWCTYKPALSAGSTLSIIR